MEKPILEIEITNIKKASGELRLAFYDKEDLFLGDEIIKGINKKVEQEGKMIISVKDLPFGTYAISLYHDEDGNGELDTNFLGIPKDPYAFSNNARGIFGPPSYEEAKFEFTRSPQKISIQLK